MAYYSKMKETRKMLRKEMVKAGIKNFSIKAGTGSSYDWTDIIKKEGDWTPKEQKILEKDFGFHVGHPSNSLLGRSHKITASLYGYKARKFKGTTKYKKFVEDFLICARNQADGGTCVLGAGTIVKRKGKPIDFIRQQGQGETRNWVAQKIMKDRAMALGLELQHEGGHMD